MVYHPKLTYQVKQLLESHPELAPILDPFLEIIGDTFKRSEGDREQLSREIETLHQYVLSNKQNTAQTGYSPSQFSNAPGESLYRRVIDATSQAVVVLSTDGTIVKPNPAFDAMFGFGASSEASSVLSLFPAEGKKKFLKSILPAVESGGVWEGRMTMLKTSGEEMFVSLRADGLQEPDGSVRFIAVILQNLELMRIYEQMQSAAHSARPGDPDDVLMRDFNPGDPYNAIRFIAETAEKRALLQCLLDPAWIKSIEGKYTAVNRAFCNLLQRVESEILGRTCEELCHGAAARVLHAVDTEVAASHRLLRKELPLPGAAGNVQWFEVIAAPAFGKNNEIVSIAGILREMPLDLTKGTEAAEMLAQPARPAYRATTAPGVPEPPAPPMPQSVPALQQEQSGVADEPRIVSSRDVGEISAKPPEQPESIFPGSKIDLQQRDAIMAAITLAAEYFLRVPPWEKHIGEVLEWLGRATNVSRAYLYQNGRTDDGVVYTSLRNAWAASGIRSVKEDEQLLHFVYEDSGLTRWLENMRSGDPVMGDVAAFPSDESAFLKQMNCKSIVLFPIMVDGVWWGFLGFDDCVVEREWKAVLIDALKTATNLIGAVIERERTEGTYRTMVEQSLQELFIAQNGRIVYANPEAVRNSGFTEQELYRFGSTDLYANVVDEDKPKIANALHSLKVESFENIRIEFRFRSRDGSIRWIESLLSRVHYKGAPAIQIVQVDVTERKLVEESLQHRSSMESLIGNLTAKFINLAYETIDGAIVESLEMLARFFDADRCHLLLIDETGKAGHVTHEWHRQELPALLPRLSNIDLYAMPYLRRQFNREGAWLCPSMNEIPDEALVERRALAELQVQSFGMVPVVVNGRTVGNITLSYMQPQDSLPREIIPALTLAGEVIITTLQRKRVEENLVRTREMYKLATEAGKVGVWDWDVSKNDFYIDETLRDMLGFTDEDVPMSVERFMQQLHPEDYPNAAKLLRGVFRNEEFTRASDTYEAEHRIQHENGDVLWFLVRALVIRDAAGNARRIVGTNTNVTALKKAEAALRESQAWNLAILNSLPDYAYIMDAEGTFTDVMVGEAQRHHPLKSEIVGKSIFDFVPETLRTSIQEKVRSVLENGAIEVIEYETGETPGAGKQFYEVRLSRISAESMLAMHRDITSRKQSERALLKTNTTLKVRNEELDAFSHTVAHDLKNPLTLVIGYAGLLNEAAADMKPSELKQYLSNILLNSKRMNSIIESLLLLAEVRQEDVKFEDMDMKYIVDEAISRLGYMIQDYNAVIVMPDQWPKSSGYSSWIEEVWVNYITNAMKYGGRPPRVELGADESIEGYVRYWVRDNGRGIAKDDIAKLFSPLTRLSTSSVKGYGLGLSIVKRIVEKLNGRIGIESEPGAGSKFWFALPVTQLEVETKSE